MHHIQPVDHALPEERKMSYEHEAMTIDPRDGQSDDP